MALINSLLRVACSPPSGGAASVAFSSTSSARPKRTQQEVVECIVLAKKICSGARTSAVGGSGEARRWAQRVCRHRRQSRRG